MKRYKKNDVKDEVSIVMKNKNVYPFSIRKNKGLVVGGAEHHSQKQLQKKLIHPYHRYEKLHC